jgi:acid phosphatase (class A)
MTEVLPKGDQPPTIGLSNKDDTMNYELPWIRPWRSALIACMTTLLIGCAVKERGSDVIPEIAPGVLAGYLPRASLPDSLALVPPAPAVDSATQALDDAVSATNLQLQGQLRWAVASQDAILKFPAAATAFECALGLPISEQATPVLYRLLRRSLADAGLATYAAKTHYQRPRPFMINGQPICSPADEAQLRGDGSYPSGHTAIGWAWGLILAELVPERRDALLVRGREFGESRSVCNVHWYSDIVAGQLVGAATVAVLHADPVFQRDLKAAAEELANERNAGAVVAGKCLATDAPNP